MFTDETPKIISRFFQIIESVEQELAGKYMLEKASRQGELSLLFKDASGRSVLCFGLRYDLWTQTQQPFWYWVSLDGDEQTVSRFTEANKGRCLDYMGKRLCSVEQHITAAEQPHKQIVPLLEAQLKILDIDR